MLLPCSSHTSLINQSTKLKELIDRREPLLLRLQGTEVEWEKEGSHMFTVEDIDLLRRYDWAMFSLVEHKYRVGRNYHYNYYRPIEVEQLKDDTFILKFGEIDLPMNLSESGHGYEEVALEPDFEDPRFTACTRISNHGKDDAPVYLLNAGTSYLGDDLENWKLYNDNREGIEVKYNESTRDLIVIIKSINTFY